jgi:hypothetical protein
MVVLLAACVPAGAAQPEGSVTAPLREPAPDAAAVFAKVRSVYGAGATTERLRIGVRRGDGAARRSLLLVRAEPAPDGGSVARLVIGAGRLLIDARAAQGPEGVGTVLAALHPDQGPLFEHSVLGAGVPDLLGAAFPPLPLGVVDILNATGSAPASLTPYARGVRWAESAVVSRSGEWRLDGLFGSGSVVLTIDRATGRIRRLHIALDAGSDAGTTITIEHAPSAARLAGVSPNNPDGSSRPRVGAVSALWRGGPDSVLGTALKIDAAPDGGPLVRALTRGPDGSARPAVVVLLGSDEQARIAAGSVLSALAEEIGAPGGTDPFSVGLGAAWGVGEAAPPWAGRTNRPGVAPLLCAEAPRCLVELRRIAPNSGAAFVVIAHDGEILAVQTLEQLLADPDQRVVELLMSVLDAAQSARPEDRNPR